MSSLIEKGTKTSELHNAFEQAAAEALDAQREENSTRAQAEITAEAEQSGSYDPELLPSGCSISQYRAARKAEESLLVADVETVEAGEGSASDWRKLREAEQRGERPRSYKDYVEGR